MKKLVVLLLMISASVDAQSPNESVRDKIPFLETDASASRITGVLSQDLFAVQPESLAHKDSLDLLETRSSLKAGFFSLLVPGAGQIYNGGTANDLKAAGFLAIEAGAIAAMIIWTNRANSQTAFFERYADGTAADNYADGRYSVLRYAQWIKINWYQTADKATQNLIDEMFVNNGPAPWQKVNFDALAEVENALSGVMPGSDDHLLGHGTEQYYELIGKYPQFREGWNPNAASDYVSGSSDDIYNYLKNSVEVSIDNYYMDQRGLANNYFGYAGTWLGVLIANHFVSAIEAAIWAHGHNKLIETSVSVSPLPSSGAGYQTQLNVALNF